MKRLLSLFLSLSLLLPLAACGGDKLNSFTWFVSEIPANLDPQIAQTSAEVIACTHLYSGLFRHAPDGSLENDACESYTVSADGRTYTFTLKEGLTYQDDNTEDGPLAVTAADYLFAFRRIFRAETASPYTASFGNIQNSAAVLAGTMDESELGVSAPDDRTLVIQLTDPDEDFLEKLTLPGAMPCNEAFFENTQGTYGLSKSTILSNGPFYLYNWTASGLFLRRAASGSQINSLRLVQNTDTTGQGSAELVANGKCSAILDEGGDATDLQTIPYTDTTWCLLCNCGTVFGNTALRQALAAAVADVPLPADGRYTAATGIVPQGTSVDGVDYRQAAGTVTAAAGDGDVLYAQALTAVSVSDLAGLSILVPESMDAGYAQALNGLWQSRYALFFNIETVDDETFAQRLADGDFTLALAPLTMTQRDPLSLLDDFAGDLCGYTDGTYAGYIRQASTSAGTEKAALLASAEQQLAAEAVVTPLYAQQKRLLMETGVEGLYFDPYGPVLDVTGATR